MTPGRTRPNIETLRRVAEAFDCGLMVRFVPFSEMARWSEKFDPEAFHIPSFDEDTYAERKGPQSEEGEWRLAMKAAGDRVRPIDQAATRSVTVGKSSFEIRGGADGFLCPGRLKARPTISRIRTLPGGQGTSAERHLILKHPPEPQIEPLCSGTNVGVPPPSLGSTHGGKATWQSV
jgi:hypothetical protein